MTEFATQTDLPLPFPERNTDVPLLPVGKEDLTRQLIFRSFLPQTLWMRRC